MTILDVPPFAAEALEKAFEKDLLVLLEKALEAAGSGFKKSKGFMAKHNRPGILREKTIGLQDTGATTGVLIIQGFCEALKFCMVCQHSSLDLKRLEDCFFIM